MDEYFHVVSKMKKPWLKMWQFEGIWSRFQCLAIWVLVFKNNHKLSKISHLKIFARVPLENGVWCGAFDAQSRCISRLFYLFFQHFNIGNEFANQGQQKYTWTQQCYLLALKHGPRSLRRLQVSLSNSAWQRDNANTCAKSYRMWERTLVVSCWRKFFGTKVHGRGMIVLVELSTTLATHGI